MTLSQLKTVCAAYLGKPTSGLEIDSVDMFLMAANNVRKNAELLHDFEYTRVKATLSIDGANGADLSDAVIEGNTAAVSGENAVVTGTGLTPDLTGTYVQSGEVNGENFYILNKNGSTYILLLSGSGWVLTDMLTAITDIGGQFNSAVLEGGYVAMPPFDGNPIVTLEEGSSTVPTFSGLKSITNIQRARSDGSYIPLDFTRADIALERERTELEFSDDYYPEVRYPSDAQFLSRGSTSTLIQRGNKLFVYPGATETTTDFEVVVEGYGFYRDYTAADLTTDYSGDLFLQQGSRFLQWAIITELNYLFQKFVPRQEGVLSPPEQAREAAWRDLLLWDSYLIDPNSTRSR